MQRPGTFVIPNRIFAGHRHSYSNPTKPVRMGSLFITSAHALLLFRPAFSVSMTFALFEVFAMAPSSGPQLTGHMTCCSATTQFNVMCSAVGHFLPLQVFSALSVSLRCGVASPGHWCRTFRHNVVVPPEGHEIHRCDSQKQIPLLCLLF